MWKQLFLTTLLTTGLFTAISVAANTSDTHSDALSDASGVVCDKIRVCSLRQLQKENLDNPHMRELMEQTISGICETMVSQSLTAQQHGLFDDALACLEEMAQMSCQQIESGIDSPACNRLEAKASNGVQSG